MRLDSILLLKLKKNVPLEQIIPLEQNGKKYFIGTSRRTKKKNRKLGLKSTNGSVNHLEASGPCALKRLCDRFTCTRVRDPEYWRVTLV